MVHINPTRLFIGLFRVLIRPLFDVFKLIKEASGGAIYNGIQLAFSLYKD